MEPKLKELTKPFPAKDIEWRIQQSGMKNNRPWALVLAYVTNRAIMERLDAVCGPENWKNEFKEGPAGGVLCGISICINSAGTKGEWITKWDGAENTQVEEIKGGLSGAMKRAAVQWGIGRYLYNLTAGWATFCEDGEHKSKVDGIYFKWNPPALPAWALPEGEEPAPVAKPQPRQKKTPEAKEIEDKVKQDYENHRKEIEEDFEGALTQKDLESLGIKHAGTIGDFPEKLAAGLKKTYQKKLATFKEKATAA